MLSCPRTCLSLLPHANLAADHLQRRPAVYQRVASEAHLARRALHGLAALPPRLEQIVLVLHDPFHVALDEVGLEAVLLLVSKQLQR